MLLRLRTRFGSSTGIPRFILLEGTKSSINRKMKLLFRAVATVAAIALFGCAESGGPDLSQTGEQLERGVTGQGTLYEQPQSDDPFIGDQAR
jgi:hypothetical protein